MAAEDVVDDDEGAAFSAFSMAASLPLRSLFASGVSQSLHALRLSTVRLSAETLSLLSSMLFLSHLELRLFESVADEWYTAFLSSEAPLTARMDATYLHGALFANDCPSSVGPQGDRVAVAACARALRGCVRRLCHLRSLCVVEFVDEADSDEWPILSAQSEAIVFALHGHPHLQQLHLKRPRFSASPLFSSTLTAERLRAIPHLRSLHLSETESLPPAQCEALLSCEQLTEVCITHSEGDSVASKSCFAREERGCCSGVRMQGDDERRGHASAAHR